MIATQTEQILLRQSLLPLFVSAFLGIFGDATALPPPEKIYPSNPEEGAGFGNAIAIVNGLAIIGAPREWGIYNQDRGTVFVYWTPSNPGPMVTRARWGQKAIPCQFFTE